MRYIDWFEKAGIDLKNGVCVTVASDGLKPGRDKILAVSLLGSQDHQNLGTVYIRGADPEKVKEYTGVSSVYYHNNAVGPERAKELITPALAGCQFLILYTGKKYTVPWLLDGGFLMLTQFPYLDVVDAIRFVERGRAIPSEPTTIWALQLRLSELDHIRGGFSVDALCQRHTMGYDGDRDDKFEAGSRPELERKVFKLRRLWEAMLQLGK